MSTIIKTDKNGQEEHLESIEEPLVPKILYWSRSPGRFLNKYLGTSPWDVTRGHGGPCFEGTVREWYETLAETVIDAHSHIHKRQYRAPNIIEAGLDAFSILEATCLFQPVIGPEGDGSLAEFIYIRRKTDMPKDEIRMALVSDFTTKPVPGIPSDPPEMMDIGGTLVQAPVLPGLEIKKLPAPQLIDEMTIKILDMYP